MCIIYCLYLQNLTKAHISASWSLLLKKAHKNCFVTKDRHTALCCPCVRTWCATEAKWRPFLDVLDMYLRVALEKHVVCFQGIVRQTLLDPNLLNNTSITFINLLIPLFFSFFSIIWCNFYNNNNYLITKIWSLIKWSLIIRNSEHVQSLFAIAFLLLSFSTDQAWAILEVIWVICIKRAMSHSRQSHPRPQMRHYFDNERFIEES